MIIGLVSSMGSGKGEVVKILEKQGFKYITLSQMVREEARKQGVPEVREQLMEIGNKMRSDEGPGVLAKRSLAKINESDHGKWVVDGIRNPAEIIALRAGSDVRILGINVDQEILVKRILARGDGKDSQDQENIIKTLEKEWEEPNNPNGQQVGLCMELTDKVINNNGSLEELDKQVTEYYNELT